MTIQRVLDGLVRRAGADDPPGLADAVAGLRSVRTWEGPWDALASPGRASVVCPAALVSLVDLTVVALGRTVDGLRTLAPGGAVDVPPPRRTPAAPRPTCRLEIAVTLLGGGSGARDRAAGLLDLVEEVLVVMVGHAVEGIVGTNLDTDKLRMKGLSAFVLVGRREIEIAPADEPRQVPAAVDTRGLLHAAGWPRPEC